MLKNTIDYIWYQLCYGWIYAPNTRKLSNSTPIEYLLEIRNTYASISE
jgi:hypothetical protein